VSVWDVDTGSKIMQFSQAHGEAEITAMSFDPSGRRLITGGRDGTVKIWNFNNGACLSVLHNEDTAEVRYVAVAIVGGATVGVAVVGWSCVAAPTSMVQVGAAVGPVVGTLTR